MNRLNAVCDWLGNHELVALMFLVGITGCAILGVCRWIAHGIIPDEEDEHAKHPGI